MLRTISFFVLTFIVLVLPGCQNNPYETISVSGTVKLDGKPIEGVKISFVPVSAGTMAAFGMTTQNGSFVLSTGGAKFGGGAQPGEYNVTFSKIDVEDKYKPDKNKNLPPEEFEKRFGTSAPIFIAPKIHIVPEKYGNPSTSGIAPVIIEKRKKNVFNFDLSTN
ncbi:MAG: carboxypeptidase-like regulatory domain-containing protein [Planctomycetaceae bacterium]|jgi:hypothetical protein|nr:carboxypeptidase-like regulatory domain-containing protein [Planctomycetaceae bacterium]